MSERKCSCGSEVYFGVETVIFTKEVKTLFGKKTVETVKVRWTCKTCTNTGEDFKTRDA